MKKKKEFSISTLLIYINLIETNVLYIDAIIVVLLRTLKTN